MDPEYKNWLRIYSDCCYSGKWAMQLTEHQEQFENKYAFKINLKKDHDPEKVLKKRGKSVILNIYAACAHDEVATENVFTDLLKG